MDTLDLDIETYCDLDIKKVGAHKYIAHPSFQVLLLAFSFNKKPTRVIDLYKNPIIPQPLLDKILDPNVLLLAYNWTFERLGISKHIGISIPVERGRCTMVKSAMVGLPFGLKEVGKVLNIKTQKDSRGEALLKYFTKPCKPTKANGGRVRNLPEHAPEAWEAFKQYDITDVDAEMGVDETLDFFTPSDFENEIYALDQKINDRGVLVDRTLIINALQLDKECKEEQKTLFTAATGIDKPTSHAQVKKWIFDKSGIVINSLNKDVMDIVRNRLNDFPEVLQMLDSLTAFNKTSITKYAALYRMMSDTGRVCGLHQYYGANRTGRFAGRGIQPHNLPRTKFKEITGLRKLLYDRDFELIKTFYDPQEVLKQLIRPTIIAPDDKVLGITDFTSIEAVIISWLAGEKWRLEAFKNGVDIYKASASQMFNIPFEAIDDELRQRGKVSELSLGFQGGVGALIRMGALKMGIAESELEGLKERWRTKNPAIVRMWKVLGDMAYDTVKKGIRNSYRGIINMFMYKGRFVIELPSKRWLVYHNAKILNGKITYEGLNDKNKWGIDETYGGKLTENIVQAIARDILAVALRRLDRFGFDIVMHVHDEIIIELLKVTAATDILTINKIMGLPIKWAKGCPVSAKSFLSPFYKKD